MQLNQEKVSTVIYGIVKSNRLQRVCFRKVISLKHWMLAGPIALALGEHHSMILRQDGSVWSTAIRFRKKLALRAAAENFRQVISSGALALAAGHDTSIVLRQDGSVWATGQNQHGQLGDGTKTNRVQFFSVQMIAGAKSVAAGGSHALLITHEGRVWSTGWNKHGLAHPPTHSLTHSLTRQRSCLGHGVEQAWSAWG